MKLQTFFDKFELFADAPDAVRKMRELVLELAVQGKLVAQDANDDSVAEHSERDTHFDIPATWHWQALGTIGVCRTGRTPPTDDLSNYGVGFPFIGPGQLTPSGRVARPEKTITQSGLANSTEARANDILMVCIGGSIGKAAICKETLGFNQQINMVRLDRDLPTFIYLVFRSAYFQEQVLARASGSATPIINKGKWEQILIPIPPLAEQERIVAKVDELMALCNQLEAQQQERQTKHTALARASLARFADAPTPANLNFLFHNSYSITPADLRKSILTLAVQGQLLDGGKADEWQTVAMKDVCIQITDGEHATPQRTARGVPLATAKNVRDGFLDLSNTDFVEQTTAEKCWRRCKPRNQDILMVCVGATTGRVCLVKNPPDIVLVRSVALIRPKVERIAPTYLNLFLRSPSGQSQIWRNVKQSAQPCLYLGKIAEFEIILPTVDEQRRIVAKVDELMKLVDQLESQLTASRSTAEKLTAAIVAELTQVANAA